MTKKTKILIIVVIGLFIIALAVGIVLILDHKNDDNKDNGDKEEKKLDGGVYMESVKGEIIELNDDDTIVIKVTETNASLVKKDDMVTLKVSYLQDSTLKYYEMKTGDVLGVQF